MHRLTIAIPFALLCGTALAADFRPPPPPAPIAPLPTWTGFYLGLNAGGGVANSEVDFSITGLPPFATIDNSLTGAIAGAQAGYNWQTGSFVLGAEADFQWSGLKGSLTTPCPPGFCGPPPLAATYAQELPWFGTARGRVGYATPTWLIYATGGFAYAQLETDAAATAGGLTAAFSSKETRTGWTAGAGIEVAFAPQWSAKLEYLHLDFGDRSFNWVLPPLPPITDTASVSMNVVRGGVNYRF